MSDPIDRREFLKHSLMAATVVATMRPESAAANQTEIKRTGAAKKVIIIGAGLAGLSAAYELTQAGHDCHGAGSARAPERPRLHAARTIR